MCPTANKLCVPPAQRSGALNSLLHLAAAGQQGSQQVHTGLPSLRSCHTCMRSACPDTRPRPLQNGAPGALQSVERRRGEALAGQQPSMAGMLRLQLLKHSALGLWPCADQDQEHLKRVLGDLPALPAPAVVPAADGAVALAGETPTPCTEWLGVS